MNKGRVDGYFELREDERLDDIARGGLKIIQSPSAFCFSMDAVLLANFATVKKGDRVVDLGTGTAVIPLILSTRQQLKKITGIELQGDWADRSIRSVRGNNLDHLIEIIYGDLRDAQEILGVGKFDLVTSNPPYLPVGRGTTNQEGPIAIARHEIMCCLEDVISSSSRLVKYGGRVALVHRPERLAEIIILMNKYNLKPRRLQLVHPRPDRGSNMVLVEAQLGGNPELVILEPFVIYDGAGEYTRQFWDTYYPDIPYQASGGGIFDR